MAFVMYLQVSAVLLNLLPVPPLDGFQALAPWMQPDTRERLYGLSNVGLFALFLALWYIKPFGQAFDAVVDSICDFMGVDKYWTYLGYKAFRFWEH
jgi:Zn-dependent protease